MGDYGLFIKLETMRLARIVTYREKLLHSFLSFVSNRLNKNALAKMVNKGNNLT